MAISLEQMNKTVLPMFGINSDTPFNQKAIDQLLAANPAIASRVGTYNQILEGRPIVKAAKGGYIFSPDELGNPRVKEEMKDNPEFSEFSIDQQDATANKMQQRFAQPEDRMNRTRGYAVGGMQPTVTATNTPPLPPNMQPFNSKGVAFTGTGNDGYGSITQGPEDFYNSTTNSFGNELPPVSQPINYGSVNSPGDPLTLPAGYTPQPLPADFRPRRGGPRGPGTEIGGPPPLPTYSAEYKAANPLGPAMPTPRGPEPTPVRDPNPVQMIDGRPAGMGYSLDDPKMQPFLNSIVKPPVESRLEYDPNSIYISPDTGNRLAYGVDSNGKVNKNNSLNVDMADQRRKARYQEALTKYNAQKAALGENFTNQQLKDYNIKIGRENALKNNPNIERGYYDSPEYQKVRDFRGPVNMAIGYNPYFGRFNSGTIAGMTAEAYEAYLNRTGKTSYLQGGADYTSNPNYDEYIKSQGEYGPLQNVSGPSDGLNPYGPPATTMPQFPEATFPYNPTPPPGGYPEFKGPPENDQRGNAQIPPLAQGRAANPQISQPSTPQLTQAESLQKLADDQAATMSNVYGDPSKVITPATVAPIASGADQTIAAGTGAITGAAPSVATPTATPTSQITTPVAQTPQGVMTASTSAPAVKTATDAMTAAQGTVSTGAQAVGQTATTTAVSNLDAAQGAATLMNNPVQRSIQTGELVTGAVDAANAAVFTEQIQAATATPTDKATIKGQLDSLMDDFEGGATPVWAAGAMRAATAAMSARGLGASSMAGQAIVQAAMESALPIAQADAQITAQFEAQNLSNRQQRAMLAAQQRATFIGQEFDQAFQARVQNSARIGDIANMNFTADQQVALENSRAANTMNLSNLNNRQANVMAEAAALSQLDITNLSNRQQAAVMNAQNFMQMDMQNLNNEQQTGMFTQQSVLQSLFTDQAALNAASQFNATSENQTQQFFQSLATQANQFNATQTNAMSQFDAENLSTLQRFNSELENQRDQFNAQNALVIAQANALWRQSVSTSDTAAQNAANLEFARTVNGLTGNAIDQIWQRERDLMSFAFTASESATDRAVNIAIQKLSGEQKAELYDNIGKGKLFGNLLMGVLGKASGINFMTGG